MAKVSSAGDPGLFGGAADHLVRSASADVGDAAQHLVDDAHVAADVPEERNFAAIEMRQVDAARKNLAALVFRMIDEVAAQHADFAERIEDRDIGRGFGVVERVVVLGIEKARVLDGDDRGLALALDPRRAEIDDAALDEFAGRVQSIPSWDAAWRGTDACRSRHWPAHAPGKIPWSTSTPSFSDCSNSLSASTWRRVGVRPGTSFAAK